MNLTFSIYDYIIIIIYFAIVLYIGFRAKNKNKSELEYLAAGRRITLPVFVATLVSTFYGGILGVGEFTYNYGISSWLLNSFPYYFFILIFAFFLAGRIRKAELYTIPDKLYLTYGKTSSVIGACLIFILSTPAPYVFMMGILVQLITGWNLTFSVIISLVVSLAYLFKGGLIADVKVNVFEFFMMFAGFGVLLPFSYAKFGGFDFISSSLPPEFLTLTGGNSLQYILVWFFIGAWALVDPSFHQRCYAADSPATAKKGVLISLLFWILFDFLTITSGLYAKAIIPAIDNPAMAYPILAENVLPSFIKGFFWVGMLATVMSTLHSFAFISAATFGKDIAARIINLKETSNRLTQIGLILTAILSLLIILLVPSVVQIWYTIGSLVIPALLISVISSYFPKITIGRIYINSAMILSFVISLLYFLIGQNNIKDGYPDYPLGLEPVYPGLIAGIIIFSIGLIVKRLNKI